MDIQYRNIQYSTKHAVRIGCNKWMEIQQRKGRALRSFGKCKEVCRWTCEEKWKARWEVGQRHWIPSSFHGTLWSHGAACGLFAHWPCCVPGAQRSCYTIRLVDGVNMLVTQNGNSEMFPKINQEVWRTRIDLFCTSLMSLPWLRRGVWWCGVQSIPDDSRPHWQQLLLEIKAMMLQIGAVIGVSVVSF